MFPLFSTSCTSTIWCFLRSKVHLSFLPTNMEGGQLRSVRWGHASLTFELCSSDAGLLIKASSLFSLWQTTDSTLPLQSWWIEPQERSDPEQPVLWEVRSSAGTPMIVRKSCEHALMTVEFLAVQMLLDHPQCPLSFHSALVAKQDKSVMILGPNAAGKSTLACALWQHGWSLVGDDITLVDTEAGSAYSAPRRVSLRRPSRALLGEDLWRQIQVTPSYHQTEEGCVFHPYEVVGPEAGAASQLAAIIFLARRGV